MYITGLYGGACAYNTKAGRRRKGEERAHRRNVGWRGEMELMGSRLRCFHHVVVVAVLFAVCGDRSSVATAFTIPSTYDGFAFPSLPKPSIVPVMVEAFIDPMCPDCRSAWPTMKSLVQLYGPSLSLILHPFPVPFHHNAFFSARALHIANSLNATSTVALLELIYEYQESFSNDATADQAPSSVIQRFVALGVEAGLSPHLFFQGFSDTSTDQATRISFKYGCSRYVTSTPNYLVNGVPIGADETWTVGQWRSILEPLVSKNLALAVGENVYDEPLRISNQ